jgi:glycosyltransferase involved in cell wall biosynthesis
VRVLFNEVNLGLIPTLNRGVAEATGDFVARMDADDVTSPSRIRRQLEVLRRRPDVGVVGTGAQLIDEEGTPFGWRPVRCTGPTGAGFMALFATPLIHPTITARTRVMRAFPYGEGLESLHTEDYELFTRMLRAGIAVSNIDAPLHKLRINRASVSQRFESVQVDNFVACARRHLQESLGLRPGSDVHRVLVNRMDERVTGSELREGFRCLAEVEQAFRGTLSPGAERAYEIDAVAAQQRVDILTQAAIKGRPRVRLTAAWLALRHAPSVLSGPGRTHLLGKLRRR